MHCDSLPNASADEALLGILKILVGKLTKSSRKDHINQWYFLPLHNSATTPVQTDGTSCGIYTCIFALSVLQSMDTAFKEELLPKYCYWIAYSAIKGATYKVEKLSRYGNSKWEDIKCKPMAISIIRDMVIDSGGPFTSLAKFLNSMDNSKVSVQLKDSLQFSCHDNGSTFKSFPSFCEREAGKICAHINTLQRRPLKELLGETTERLSAVATLRATRYRYLQEHAEFPFMRKALGNVLYTLQHTVHKIFCTTVPNENDKLFFPINKVKFTICKTWGMTRSQFIERVVFPELMTYFYMEKYKENYEEATSRLYGGSGKMRTVYWEDICKDNDI